MSQWTVKTSNSRARNPSQVMVKVRVNGRRVGNLTLTMKEYQDLRRRLVNETTEGDGTNIDPASTEEEETVGQVDGNPGVPQMQTGDLPNGGDQGMSVLPPTHSGEEEDSG